MSECFTLFKVVDDSNKINIEDFIIDASSKPTNLKELRRKAGLVFQFPEYQLFEETILKDLCFGPKNFGATEEEAQEKAIRALKLVGLEKPKGNTILHNRCGKIWSILL